ncbi:MAG: rhodanese-like domain-containing protein [Rhodobacterales bacterium]|jgi:rhodanese-related sulfurtransferase|nr:rhodanese-like domain-containing protein [Pseudomonadota bacterium]MDA1284871.1 rhodanese-like domain-containing protein [Pseudomonadota bacterium]
MPIKSVKSLVDAARTEITIIPTKQVIAMMNDPDVMLVDIRDIRELDRDGRIPGAFHAPRGMLEFWVDPQSPYHKPALSTGKKMIFFCASAWRSALTVKTLQDMGVTNIFDLEGGFTAWRAAGGPIDKPEPRG